MRATSRSDGPRLPARHGEQYGVAVHRYPPGARFAGAGGARTCYVLGGAVRLALEGEVALRAGDVADLPAGRFEVEVLGDDPLEIAERWELPPPFDREP